ncbi:uncharacterized protein LOC111680148 [Lucilia cuprina]|uniref:uncharacterized protein LOC111680148 n=1 Tax=Lucilia cuprina TaxID=7375 RepID=UPI001F060AD8|nr:uncharacterized protein LOC111680148 [Lucilia cuprina]
MFKNIVCVFFVAFLLRGNSKKLSGTEFDDAVKILNGGLTKLKDATGDWYTAREVDAAFKFIPNEVYSYEITASDYRNDRKNCTITVTYSYGVYNALVSVQCGSETAVNKTIVNQVNVEIVP